MFRLCLLSGLDVSCDESDTISTTSSTPTTTNVPYNILKPILKQPQQTREHQQPSAGTTHQVIVQQSATTTVQPKSILKDNSQQHHLQQQQQQQMQLQMQQHQITHQSSSAATSSAHRTLPQPPKNAGLGAYHTKETALQRIQQQSGLLQGSRTNLSNLCGANPLGLMQQQQQGSHHYNSVPYDIGVGLRSCSTFNMTTIGNNNTTAAGGGIGSANIMTSNNNNGTFASGSGYMELHSPTHGFSSSGKLNETLLNTHTNSLSTSSTRTNLQSIRTQKSPILNRRRSSSIVANLLTADFSYNRNSAVANSSSSSSSSAATTAPQSQQQQSQVNAMATSNNDATNISSLTHSNTR